MEAFLGALLIFSLRICDVSIGTMRVLLMVQGRKLPATILAFVESGVWILAISKVFSELNSWQNMLGYALGFSVGTLVGLMVEGWIAHGRVIVRVFSRDEASPVRDLLAAEGFGVTRYRGEGVAGKEVQELMVVTARRRTKHLLKLVHQLDPDAFITVTAVNQIIGGYLPQSRMFTLRK